DILDSIEPDYDALEDLRERKAEKKKDEGEDDDLDLDSEDSDSDSDSEGASGGSDDDLDSLAADVDSVLGTSDTMRGVNDNIDKITGGSAENREAIASTLEKNGQGDAADVLRVLGEVDYDKIAEVGLSAKDGVNAKDVASA